ncbi:hypothetical protein [Austwickia chelonae]|uniref:hypothetical protein n=1 Tax=Austwickia chelonae TaxID=100225 RepID=UPI000E287B65|nr:hypothetical protein [Austwickia chelonae]
MEIKSTGRCAIFFAITLAAMMAISQVAGKSNPTVGAISFIIAFMISIAWLGLAIKDGISYHNEVAHDH